jgi:hypothetical protein
VLLVAPGAADPFTFQLYVGEDPALEGTAVKTMALPKQTLFWFALMLTDGVMSAPIENDGKYSVPLVGNEQPE